MATIAGSMVLVACGAGEQPSSTASDAQVPSPTNSLTVIMDEQALDFLHLAPGIAAEVSETGELALSGTSESRGAGGRTAGIAVPIEAELEALFSGQTVIIKVTARSAADSPQVAGITYSTAGVGNSGWKEAVFDSNATTFSFEYGVAPMSEGNNDYIGIYPDWDGDGIGIVVEQVSVELVQSP